MKQYIANYFKLAGKGKGLASGRGEYLTGMIVTAFGIIMYNLVNWFFTSLSVREDSASEIILLGVPIIIVIIFVIPVVGLIMRRLHDAGFNGMLWLLLIPCFLILGLFTYIIVLAIALLPSKRPNKYILENGSVTEQGSKLSENTIIGISLKGALRTFLLICVLPVLLLLLLLFIVGIVIT